MIGSSADVGGSVSLTPTGGIRRHAKFPTTVVGFCAAHHPRIGRGVHTSGRRPTEVLPPETVPQIRFLHSRMGCHTTSSEIDRPSYAPPNSVNPGELDNILNCHRPFGCRYPGIDRVLVRQPQQTFS